MNTTDRPDHPSNIETLDRLRDFPVLAGIPENEVRWLQEQGEPVRYAVGDVVVRQGGFVPGMYVLFEGRLANVVEQGGVKRIAMEWSGGEITGYLPYSRMSTARGNTTVEEPVEGLLIPREIVDEMPAVCPKLTTKLVHSMLDRVREFKANDLQLEKLVSLGKLAAGMAHELNNPSSAALRNAKLLRETFEAAESAADVLRAGTVSAKTWKLLGTLKELCATHDSSMDMSALERADREDAFCDWLDHCNLDSGLGAQLAGSTLTLEQLAELTTDLNGEQLAAAVTWLAHTASVHALIRDIENASSRVHHMVNAIKGFTYMDRGSAPEPVDIGKGLKDTIGILSSRIQQKNIQVDLTVSPDLPAITGFGGELNQVWNNLLDNAIDASPENGTVSIKVARKGEDIVVFVTDNGPGIPADISDRIFEPFFTTKPIGQGSGLGLDVAQRIVNLHRGVMSASSKPGYTEFVVKLPTTG